MVQCKFCPDKTEYEWFQDSQDRWHIGIKIDINNFRQHKCSPIKEETNNKRNWIKFTCEKCGEKVNQNVKLYQSKTLNYCYDCDNPC